MTLSTLRSLVVALATAGAALTLTSPAGAATATIGTIETRSAMPAPQATGVQLAHGPSRYDDRRYRGRGHGHRYHGDRGRHHGHRPPPRRWARPLPPPPRYYRRNVVRIAPCRVRVTTFTPRGRVIRVVNSCGPVWR
ncbi:hypothetical protein L1787_23615 [Acuticoccus sp. M5D2P5]|uniref:hypothetical protein n=1 Tax=Acuticoccus kalidii TaxID=2910977 RepID=UPI001F20ADF8|nr:hypothetical protein [Acuticoccus kalidii]MCF3936385.1 hypothetical protein [Acuticoccus kalidii]